MNKDFFKVLEANYQAQIAGYYNYDKTDKDREIRSAVIKEYKELISIYKNGSWSLPTPPLREQPLREAVKADDDFRQLLKRFVTDFALMLQPEQNIRNEYAGYETRNQLSIEKLLIIARTALEGDGWVSVHDNSDGFRDFLQSEGIEFKRNEHWTMVKPEVDLYWLGRKVEAHKNKTYPTSKL